MEYEKSHIDACLPYAIEYKKMNAPAPDRLAMFAAFKVHDAIYGHGVSRDRLHPESGKTYHEWLKSIIADSIRGEL